MSSPSQNGGNRRRSHERLEVSPRLYVILDGAASDGILNDVSEGGVALDMMGAQPENDTVELRFEMAEIGRHFEAKGRVAWRDEAGRRVGVGFVDLPEVSRGQIKEWLAAKGVSAESLAPAVVQEMERDGASQRPGANDAAAQKARASETGDEPGTWHSAGEPHEGDRLLQNLLNSFSKPQSVSAPREPGFRGLVADLLSKAKAFFSAWETRRWIFVVVAIVIVVLVLLGLSALRSPAKNASAAFSLSKVGHRLDAGNDAGGYGSKGGSDAGGANGGSNGNGSPMSQIPTASLAASFSNASATPGHLPCVNLGPRSDKIRVYLWSEKGTPENILQSYSRYLTAVSDIRVADKAPYDLVLYINGANVDAKSSEAGFIWTSRVFRPWFCGQGLGLLEQTEVNESLHYVRGEELDQRVQAEVAYLILHTFEAIRTEQPK
ncbi:MAG TPA: PilZ domain-containing protein [Candidatus Acidoferrum sp.]